MLPITEGVYDFRTDVKEDLFFYETAGGTTANVTLIKEIYDDDISTVSILSDDGDDIPTATSYDPATRTLGISGLDTATNRTLAISYDVDALGLSTAMTVFIDRISWIWLLCVIAFAPAAIAAIFMNKA